MGRTIAIALLALACALTARAEERPAKPVPALKVAPKVDGDLGDWRESPALKVLELLKRDGARVNFHDPHVPNFVDEHGESWHSIPLSQEMLERADCVLILTDHTSIDYTAVCNAAKAVVDTRNATRNVSGRRENVTLL